MENYTDLFNPSFLKKEKTDVRPPIPKDASVTMAYIPLQIEVITYEPETALNNGTLFPCLNKEFLGGRSSK